MCSLKLTVFVTDSFATFEYNGIVRTKDVTPYSLFGDLLLMLMPKVDSMMSDDILMLMLPVRSASSRLKYSSILIPARVCRECALSQYTSDDIVLALPARHDRETFVLGDSLDMSYSIKYSLQFLQQRFIILYEGIRFLHFFR